MLSELITSISKHLVYSLLEHDYENGVEIINTITQLSPNEIVYFLSRLASDFDGLFYRFEVDLEGYLKVKDEAIDAMKRPLEEDQEEFS